jgi:hypothetical protein
MVELNFDGDIKMLRETLCLAQGLIGQTKAFNDRAGHGIARLQELINECDRHRPLGVNGKHDNLHTETCGCEDKGPASTWGRYRPIRGELYYDLDNDCWVESALEYQGKHQKIEE